MHPAPPIYRYVDLEMQDLEIQLHEAVGSSALKKTKRRSTHRISLMSLAQVCDLPAISRHPMCMHLSGSA